MTDFDAAAPGYDEVAESALGRALRQRVSHVVGRFVHAGSAVLDLGAGTGLDALAYVEGGASVTAVEQSSAMAAIARTRLIDRAVVINADVLDVELPPAAYDLVVSNFGMLNCLPSLSDFGERVAKWCRRDATLVLVVMGRWVPWELAGGIRHLDRSRITRRFGADVNGVRYWTPSDVAAALPGFERVAVESLGLVLPTYQQRGAVETRPRLLTRLARLDRRLARIGGRFGAGDHWVGTWRRR